MTTRRRVTICTALAVALTAHGVNVSAQQPTYKYTTPMPPGVASPDKDLRFRRTRIGQSDVCLCAQRRSKYAIT